MRPHNGQISKDAESHTWREYTQCWIAHVNAPIHKGVVMLDGRKPYDTYIGRHHDRNGQYFEASIWGNHKHLPLDEFENCVRNNECLMGMLPTLRGKVLGCWHWPNDLDQCHGTVLLKLLAELDGTTFDPEPTGPVTFVENFYTAEETQALFDACSKLDFVRRKVRGKEVRHAVRIFCDDENAVRRKDAVSRLSEAPDAIKKLLADLSKHSGKNVNYAAVVEYRDGNDFIGWHQHDEDRGNDATVWIVSTGAERPFRVKPVEGGAAKNFLAKQGSLITLSSEANETHLHSVPKCEGCTGVRYSVNCKAVPTSIPETDDQQSGATRGHSVRPVPATGPPTHASRTAKPLKEVATEMEKYAMSAAKDGKVYRHDLAPMSDGKYERKNSCIGSPDGSCLSFATSHCPADGPSDGGASSLSDVLETDVPEKYNISAKCAKGILRRAASGKRSGKLSPSLEKALKAVAAGETVINSSGCDETKQKEEFQPADKARAKPKKPVYQEGVDYVPAFLSAAEADELLELMKSQPFADCRVSYGPQVFPPPRKSNAWKDRYALAMNPQPEPEAIRSLRLRLSERYGVPFNSVQCNWHGGNSEVKAHYDPYRIVAMVRLGATRTFEVGDQRRNGGGNFKPYPMPHGSLITFLSGGLAHRMFPDPAAGDCVSLVFRLVTPPQTVASWHDKPTYGKTRAAHKKVYDAAVSEYRSATDATPASSPAARSDAEAMGGEVCPW